MGHHGPGIVDDHPAGNPTVDGQCPQERIRDHLPGFAPMGHDKGLAAVTRTEMGNLHPLIDTARHDPFLAPVELQRVTRRKMQRDERLARTGARPLRIAHETPNRRTRSAVALRHEPLMQIPRHPTLPSRSLHVLLEQLPNPGVMASARLATNRRNMAMAT